MDTNLSPITVDTARAIVVIVGGHEGGDVVVEPLVEQGPLLHAASSGQLKETVRQALDGSDAPVCVVPMTLGRDPRLVARSDADVADARRGRRPGRAG